MTSFASRMYLNYFSKLHTPNKSVLFPNEYFSGSSASSTDQRLLKLILRFLQIPFPIRVLSEFRVDWYDKKLLWNRGYTLYSEAKKQVIFSALWFSFAETNSVLNWYLLFWLLIFKSIYYATLFVYFSKSRKIFLIWPSRMGNPMRLPMK